MNAGIRVAILACVGLAGCTSAFELSSTSDEGYESFGRVGGSMQTPDGSVEVEIDEGALAREAHLTVGRLDDCFDGALACYELEPSGLAVLRPVTVTIDLVGVEELALVDPRSLAVYVNEDGVWREVASLSSDTELTSVPLTTLGLVAIAPKSPR